MAAKQKSSALAGSQHSPVSPAKPADTDPAWQQAHDALEAAFETANHSLGQTKDRAQRKTLNSLIDTLSNEITALNREELLNRTASLQAASQQLGAGIQDLKSLRDQLQAISTTIANAAKVVDAINGVLGGLSAFLATFPAL